MISFFASSCSLGCKLSQRRLGAQGGSYRQRYHHPAAILSPSIIADISTINSHKHGAPCRFCQYSSLCPTCRKNFEVRQASPKYSINSVPTRATLVEREIVFILQLYSNSSGTSGSVKIYKIVTDSEVPVCVYKCMFVFIHRIAHKRAIRHCHLSNYIPLTALILPRGDR